MLFAHSCNVAVQSSCCVEHALSYPSSFLNLEASCVDQNTQVLEPSSHPNPSPCLEPNSHPTLRLGSAWQMATMAAHDAGSSTKVALLNMQPCNEIVGIFAFCVSEWTCTMALFRKLMWHHMQTCSALHNAVITSATACGPIHCIVSSDST